MNILFVTDLYPITKNDNIPYAIEDFACLFKEFGHNVSVIRPNFLLNTFIRRHKIFKNKTYNRKDIKIYNRNFFLPFLRKDISFIKEKYDLIISHMPCGNIYASLINEELKLPHIAIVHNSDYKVLNDFKYSFYFKNRLKSSLEKANKIGARNEFLYKNLNADFILPSFIDKKHIISKKEFKNDKLKIITLSKLIKRKNIDKIILALSKTNIDFEFDIYGIGPEKEKIKKLIKKHNSDKKTTLKGFINHSLIYETLDKYDCFILPSINETFGLSYIEAMARGLVVVGSKNTGIDGIVIDNKNGFLIEPNEIEINKIIKKINSIDKEQISTNAIETVKNLTKEKIYKKYFEIIQNM